MSDNQNTEITTEYMSRNQLDMHWGHSDYNRNAKDEIITKVEVKSKAYIKGYQGGKKQ